MRVLTIILVFILSLLFLSCKKEDQPPITNITLTIQYESNGSPLLPDTILYKNEIGYLYSVSKLEYFISNITLKNKDGQEVVFEESYYLNLKDSGTNQIKVPQIAAGEYTSLSFNIGLDPVNNKTGALPKTLVNENMAWPDLMGGGYHFLKLEGKYKSESGLSEKGYAIHLGKNENLVVVNLEDNFTFNNSNNQVIILMDINQWFKKPYPIDFEIDGSYSMSDSLLMHKISLNGSSVFHLKK